MKSGSPNFLNNMNVNKKYIRRKSHSRAWLRSNKFLLNSEKNTLKFDSSYNVANLKNPVKTSILSLFSPVELKKDTPTGKHLLRYSRFTGKDAYMHLKLETYKYSQRNLRGVFIRQWLTDKALDREYSQLNTTYDLVNVNFLRKERLYTKLKYSRTPAYDIVSGGSAALLAGFIGFLVSEKFGFELVDSGDFYFFFMYLVFIAFSIRPLLWVAEPEKGFTHLLSVWRVYDYYTTLIHLILIKLNKLRR